MKSVYSILPIALVIVGLIGLSACSDPKVPKLQDELTKSKEDQARAEGQLAQIKSDDATATASFQSTIAAQKAQIESLQQQLKDSSSTITSLQSQIASNQIQQTNQKKEDLRQQSYGKAIEVLKGIRSRMAVGMSRADYLALIREANASISSDLELQGIDISQFTVPKDWPATLDKDIGGSILISLQAYKDVMTLDAASAPEKFIPTTDEVQYVLKAELRDVLNRWNLPVLMKGKITILDVPFIDASIGYSSKKTVEKYDISELNTLKQTGALILFNTDGDAVRQMLFTIASKATDSSAQLLTASPNTPSVTQGK